MKVCIYGAGAVGGYLAVLLARAGADVSAVARGEQLEAIRQRGITLELAGESLNAQLPATDNPSELPGIATPTIDLVHHLLKARMAFRPSR